MGGFVEEMGGGGDRLEVAEATCACFTQTLLRTEVKYSHLLISGGDCGSRILHKYRNSRMLRPLYEMVYYSWPVERQRRMPGKRTGLWRGWNPQKQSPWKQKPEVELYSQFPFRYIYHLQKREPKASGKDQVCHRAEPVSCFFSAFGS